MELRYESSTHVCPYYLLRLKFSHLVLVNVLLVPLSLASAQVIKERNMTAKLFFQGYYIELFLEIYSRPTNDHQKRLKYPL